MQSAYMIVFVSLQPAAFTTAKTMNTLNPVMSGGFKKHVVVKFYNDDLDMKINCY